jgi:hypothetical protein
VHLRRRLPPRTARGSVRCGIIVSLARYALRVHANDTGMRAPSSGAGGYSPRTSCCPSRYQRRTQARPGHGHQSAVQASRCRSHRGHGWGHGAGRLRGHDAEVVVGPPDLDRPARRARARGHKAPCAWYAAQGMGTETLLVRQGYRAAPLSGVLHMHMRKILKASFFRDIVFCAARTCHNGSSMCTRHVRGSARAPWRV